MKITKPYKAASKEVISQGFHDEHYALDMVLPRSQRKLTYGTPLTAPEDVLVIRLVGDTFTPGETANLTRGYGIFLQGIETGYVHQFWHTLPIFPVNLHDTIKRGQIVAFMGNSGTVRRGGKYVEIDDRLKPEKAGTHLHWEMMERYDVQRRRKFGHVDPETFIDWSLKPTYTNLDLFAATGKVLAKMSKLIK